MSKDPDQLNAAIEQVLDEFDERAGGVVALVVLMKTGIPVCSRVNTNVDPTFLAAGLAALLNVAVELSNRVFKLTPARLILDTETGSLILRGINAETMLVAIFKKQHLGAMILLVEQAANHLAQLLPSS